MPNTEPGNAALKEAIGQNIARIQEQLQLLHQQIAQLSVAPLETNEPLSNSARLAYLGYTGPIPERFCCVISQEIMDDPVCTPSAFQQIYERGNIEAWLSEHNTDPCTRIVVDVGSLVSDPLLKNEIQIFVKQQEIAYVSMLAAWRFALEEVEEEIAQERIALQLVEEAALVTFVQTAASTSGSESEQASEPEEAELGSEEAALESEEAEQAVVQQAVQEPIEQWVTEQPQVVVLRGAQMQAEQARAERERGMSAAEAREAAALEAAERGSCLIL